MTVMSEVFTSFGFSGSCERSFLHKTVECYHGFLLASAARSWPCCSSAKVFKLVTEGKACVGCVYEKGGQNFQEFGPVILASGRAAYRQ